MNNKWLGLALVVIVAVLGGLSIVLSIGNAVQVAVAPMVDYLDDIAISQRNIEKKLGGEKDPGMKDLLARLDSLEKEVKSLKGGRLAEPKEPEIDLTTVHNIPLGTSPIFGKADAPVTIVEFVDFQCPYCARFHPAAMNAAKAHPDKIRFVLKMFPLPFHPMARPAAKAAFAAGVQGKFYEMSEELFLNASALGDDKFRELAGKIGINVDQFMKDYKDRDAEWEKAIEADMKIVQDIGVRGTPTYYLNGRQTMARVPEQWKQEIDAAFNSPVPDAPAAK